MIMGKGILEEGENNFAGINTANIESEVLLGDFCKLYKDFDLVVCFGTLFSDLNTFGFKVKPDERYRIEIQGDYTVIDGEKFEGVYINDVLEALLNSADLRAAECRQEGVKTGYKTIETSDNPIKTDEIFPLIQDFLKDGDTFVIETGVMAWGASLMRLKNNSNYISQTLWGSIGYGTPASFGASIAERGRRTILFTGEGSHQLTVQEMANMFKYDTKPVIFVLNNNGYTIERLLSNDPDDEFNNITSWDYKKALELFGKNFIHHSVKTSNELKAALQKAEEEQKEKLVYVEIFTGEKDIPAVTKKLKKM